MPYPRYGTTPPQTDSEIVGANWYGADLSGQSHERVALSEVDMVEASGRGVLFSECAELRDCKLVGSIFDGCEFGVLTCRGGDWSFVGLAGADLRRVRFSDMRMREADLTGARCGGAQLRELDLSGASLHGADLTKADLRGSDISSLDPAAVKLRGMIVDPDQTMVIATALGLDVQEAE
jgi:fluoroquinolone resistance protein